MEIQPLRGKVVVRRVEEAESVGGILIPHAAKETPNEGIVLAVGPSKNGVGLLGRRVLFGRYAGAEIKVNGKEYLILKEEDLSAVIED